MKTVNVTGLLTLGVFNNSKKTATTADSKYASNPLDARNKMALSTLKIWLDSL